MDLKQIHKKLQRISFVLKPLNHVPGIFRASETLKILDGLEKVHLYTKYKLNFLIHE